MSRCDNCGAVLHQENAAMPVWAGPPYLCDDCFRAAEGNIAELYTPDNDRVEASDR